MPNKGKTNNPNGRPKGSKNRVDEAIRAQFEFFVRNASEDIQNLFEQLKAENPKQALDAIKDYAEFVLPKLARTELNHSGEVSIAQALADFDDPKDG